MNTDTIVLCYRRHLVACDNGIGFTPRKLVLCGATTNFYNPRQHLSNKEKEESIIKLLILKLASDALNQNTTSIQESELFADHAKLQPTRSTGRKVPTPDNQTRSGLCFQCLKNRPICCLSKTTGRFTVGLNT